MVYHELHWYVLLQHRWASNLTHISIGRRPLLLIGIILNAFCLMSVGIAGCFTSMAALYYIGYVMNFAQLFYAPTVGAVSWTISAEVSAIKVRAKTQSLAIVMNAFVSWVMNFIAPYLINTDQGTYFMGPLSPKVYTNKTCLSQPRRKGCICMDGSLIFESVVGLVGSPRAQGSHIQ